MWAGRPEIFAVSAPSQGNASIRCAVRPDQIVLQVKVPYDVYLECVECDTPYILSTHHIFNLKATLSVVRDSLITPRTTFASSRPKVLDV